MHHQGNCYTHLEGIQVDTVVIHIGVKVVLNYSNQSRIDSLTYNIICIVEKCRNYGVKNIFQSGIVYFGRFDTGTSHDFKFL